jgi:TolB-like protein
MRTFALLALATISALLFDQPISAQPAAPKPRGKPVEGPTLVVFDIVPEKGVDKGEANLLTELVIDKVSKLRKYEVIGQKDIDKLMDWEQNKQLKGCTDASCLIQIAGAMGADYYIEGSIGVMGDNYMITLKLMDTRRVRVVERTTEVVKKDENVIIATTARAVDAVMGVQTPAGARAAAPVPLPVPAPSSPATPGPSTAAPAHGLFGAGPPPALALPKETKREVAAVPPPVEPSKKGPGALAPAVPPAHALLNPVEGVFGPARPPTTVPKKETPKETAAVPPPVELSKKTPPAQVAPAATATDESPNPVATAEARGDLGVKEVAPAEDQASQYRLLGQVATFGGLGVAVLGGMFSALAKKSADDYRKGPDSQTMQTDLGKMELLNKFAIGSYILGGVLTVGGIVLWGSNLDAGAAPKDAGDSPPKVTIVPGLDSHGFALSVAGGW